MERGIGEDPAINHGSHTTVYRWPVSGLATRNRQDRGLPINARWFLALGTEIRRVVCSTNATESVNARIRRAVRARGHFPNEQAALK